MCEQASNLWKETSVLKSGDNFQLIWDPCGRTD
jgi:hypothetical protein